MDHCARSLKIYFIYVYVCGYVCHICAGARGGQQRVSDPWRSKLPGLGVRNQIQALSISVWS